MYCAKTAPCEKPPINNLFLFEILSWFSKIDSINIIDFCKPNSSCFSKLSDSISYQPRISTP